MNNVSLYIHIPFCARKCLFCSFAVAVAQIHRQQDYVNALINEMVSYEGQKICSVYFGGGTPSTLGINELARLMSEVRARFTLNDGCEITLEANPEDFTEEKLSAFYRAGINRLSIGVQSFDDRYLRFLGRAHDSRKAKNAFAVAAAVGIKNISGDLMYGFPGQTALELESDIDQMVEQGCTHISIYTLTIEPNSRFHAQAVKLDDEQKLADHYQLIIDRLRAHGFDQYEVSNFAKKGYESKHNSHYWLGHEYVGLGMGAHGYWQGRRYWNHDRLNVYLDAISAGQSAVAGSELLSEETKLKERLIFGLRMNQGVSEHEIFHGAPKELLNTLYREINLLIEAGLLIRHQDRLSVTDQGRMVLDEIAIKLV